MLGPLHSPIQPREMKNLVFGPRAFAAQPLELRQTLPQPRRLLPVARNAQCSEIIQRVGAPLGKWKNVVCVPPACLPSVKSGQDDHFLPQRKCSYPLEKAKMFEGMPIRLLGQLGIATAADTHASVSLIDEFSQGRRSPFTARWYRFGNCRDHGSIRSVPGARRGTSPCPRKAGKSRTNRGGK